MRTTIASPWWTMIQRQPRPLDVVNVSARRSFAAWNPKWKQKKPRIKNKRKSTDQIYAEKLKKEALRRERNLQKKANANAAFVSSGSEQPKDFVPPALLLPTGSPHAYISKLAAQKAKLDPRDLFPPGPEQQRRPPLFRNTTFVYDGVETFDGNNDGGRRYDQPVAQVAFLGRSNVGKSSLVNALMRRDLARCSKQPGRTQQVHRFALVSPESLIGNNNKSNSQSNESPLGMFLDLPGYGYAVAPDDVLEDWQSRTQQVLKRERREGHLRRLFLLLDARHGVTSVDHTVLDWLEHVGEIPHTVVFTKADAVSKPQLIKGINQACMWYQKQLFVASEDEENSDDNDSECWISPVVHATSTKGAGQGLTELLSTIEVEFLVDDGSS